MTTPTDKKKVDQEQYKNIYQFVGGLGRRIIQKKKWWLIPLWAFLVALALILVLSGNSAILPVIYIAF